MRMIACQDEHHCCFLCPPLTPFTWAASGIETGLLWFLGRATWGVQVTRERAAEDTVLFKVHPLTRPGPLLYSNCSRLDVIHELKQFPLRLVKPWAADPQNRIDQTLINCEKIDLNQTLGQMAYGIAETVLHVFKEGATQFKTQWSRELTQIWLNAGMDDKQIRTWLNPSARSWAEGDHVDVLKW